MTEIREWSRRDAASFFRAPTRDDDKYSRGVVALRTGSSAYPGAAVLGVEAAWRTGAGFVRHVGAQRVADAVLARRPETVTGTHAGRSRPDAWVIGSGTDPQDRSSEETAALRELLAGDVPVVVDAGALDLAPGASAPVVLTPHSGEFQRLQDRLGLAAADDAPREQALVRVATAIGGVVLLKGATTLVADARGGLIAVSESTGWLATAGTGDVLAGVLGAVIAADPTRPLLEAAATAAWVHGRAARVASGAIDGGAGHPIVALDVASALPLVIGDLIA